MLNFANCAVCNFSPVCMCQYCYPTSPCLSVSRPVKIAILAKILCLSSLLFLQRVADAVGDEPSLCQSQHNFSAHQATYTSFRTAFCMRKLSWILFPAAPASIEPDTKYAPSYLMAGAISTWLKQRVNSNVLCVLVWLPPPQRSARTNASCAALLTSTLSENMKETLWSWKSNPFRDRGY